jgi:hypothetical protein
MKEISWSSILYQVANTVDMRQSISDHKFQMVPSRGSTDKQLADSYIFEKQPKKALLPCGKIGAAASNLSPQCNQ